MVFLSRQRWSFLWSAVSDFRKELDESGCDIKSVDGNCLWAKLDWKVGELDFVNLRSDERTWLFVKIHRDIYSCVMVSCH